MSLKLVPPQRDAPGLRLAGSGAAWDLSRATPLAHPGDAEAEPPAVPFAELPFAGSLCHRCQHLKLTQAARTLFLRCLGTPIKYPPQPVLGCRGFAAAPGVPRTTPTSPA